MALRLTAIGFVFTLSVVFSEMHAPCVAAPPGDAEADQVLARLRTDRLSRISIALRNFEKEHGHFPKRVIISDAGEAGLSWRVALLPFLGHDNLYRQFRLNEPWNSEHNRQLIGKMPDVFDVGDYAEREKDAAAGYTHVVVPVVEGALWHGDANEARDVYDIRDGTAYTLAAFVAPPGAAITWTKPDDLSLNPENIGRGMFGERHGCLITMFDGAAQRIASSSSNADLKALITFDGRDKVIWKRLKPGFDASKSHDTETNQAKQGNRRWSLSLAANTTDAILERRLRSQPDLTYLSLKHTQVTAAGLRHLEGLPTLRTLDLSDTAVTDNGLAHLQGQRALEKLYLNNTAVTDAGLEYLQGLTKLKRLILIDTEVTDAGLAYLQDLTDLEFLILTRTQVSSSGLEHLKGMTKLKYLHLTATRVTDAGLAHLQGLTTLRTLTLGLTHVTDAGLEHLKGLNNLDSLDLRFTQVTDAGVKDLRTKLPKRCSVITGSLFDPLDGADLKFAPGTIRHGIWKLYADVQPTATIALFDLSKDPRERNNVAADHPEVVARLLPILRKFVITMDASEERSKWLDHFGTDR